MQVFFVSLINKCFIIFKVMNNDCKTGNFYLFNDFLITTWTSFCENRSKLVTGNLFLWLGIYSCDGKFILVVRVLFLWWKKYSLFGKLILVTKMLFSCWGLYSLFSFDSQFIPVNFILLTGILFFWQEYYLCDSTSIFT